MEIENKLKIYEIEGQKAQMINAPMISVKSHWNLSRMVVIKCEDGKSYTVRADELREAINNATNSCK